MMGLVLSWLPSWSVTFGAGGAALAGLLLLGYSLLPLARMPTLAAGGGLLLLGAACYLAGIGSAQSVCEEAGLRAELAAAKRDLSMSRIAAEDATRRATILNETLQANQERLDDYETALAARPDARCALTGDDLRGVLGKP